MRVGIITYHRALNYGAALQAYALVSSLRKIGYEADVIDYKCEKIENSFCYAPFKNGVSVKAILKYLLQGEKERDKRKKFIQFWKTYLNLSGVEYDTDTISEANNKYSLFIVGSDQVWNYSGSDFDKTFFLDFVDNNQKKKSYAASFGISVIPDEYKNEYSRLLKQFSRLSVREEQGIQILRNLGMENVREDIDPSLLLTKEEWINNLQLKAKNKSYILIYCFELTETMISFANYLSKQTGYSIVYIGNVFQNPFEGEVEFLRSCGPVEFVEAFYNAKYIVTNSFHGTVFSINMNVPFFTELLKTDSKVNSRLVNVLEKLGLSSRILAEERMPISDCIDWNIVNRKLDVLRNESIKYLRDIGK